MERFGKVFFLVLMLVGTAGTLRAEDPYEIRNLTQEQWLNMSTDQRMRALGEANTREVNRTLIGNFGTNYDIFKRWGYEFYEMDDRYQNYSFRNFDNYNIIEERRLRWSYNMFGDRIPKMRSGDAGYDLWRETKNDDGTLTIKGPYNYLNNAIPAAGERAIDGVWVLKEATNDWSVSAIAAAALRAKYTPLTLNLPNMDAVRIDFHSTNNEASLLTSAPLSMDQPWSSEMYTAGGALMRAGHFRHKFGALTLGGTYANQYNTQGNRQAGDSWYGTVSNYTPTPIVLCVRVLDDSPADGVGGPSVSNVRLKINGRYRDDIVPEVIIDDLTRERTSVMLKETDKAYVMPESAIKVGKTDIDFLSLGSYIPKYLDYIWLNDVYKGQALPKIDQKVNLELAKKYYQIVDPRTPVRVNGTQYVVYLFDISSIKDQVTRSQVELTVSNDYRVEIAEIYTQVQSGGHTSGDDPKAHYNATYWRSIAQAEGNVKDGSNTRRVTADFGTQIASILYGMDVDFNYLGLKIAGEYVMNSNHYMFPDDKPGTGFPSGVISYQPPRKGHKWAEIDRAYYFTLQKDWRSFGIAGEMFKMGKFFKPYLDLYYPKAYDMGYQIGSINARNGIVRLPFVEDNDDGDQYADTQLTQRAQGYRILSTEDPDGVFPGNDADHDGIADNNKNNNEIPDYYEPFLMFDVDPDDFVFGNDYNNNNIPDFREDDMKMDFPYDLDRQGRHIFVRYSPIQSVNLFLGTMRTGGVGSDLRTNDDYFKLQVNYDVFDVGKIYAEYRHEKIADNFRDTYVQVSTSMVGGYLQPGITATTGRFSRQAFYDELEYRNSLVDRIWITSIVRALPSLTTENNVKFERNHQVEGLMYDNMYQPNMDINTIAMVNKIIYTKSWGNWTFSPGIKFRYFKKDRAETIRAGDYYIYRIPLVMLKYTVSPRTDIQLGLQGVPGFEFTYADYIQSMNDYTQKTYSLQLQNRSTYFGYQVWAATGIRYDQKKFVETYRAFEDYKSSTLFVKVLLGY